MRRETICGIDVEVAETFAERAKGLIGRRGLPAGAGMMIPKCNCIHTCFMRFPIDVLFLDKDGNVVKTVRKIRPWRLFVWGGWRAKSVVETDARLYVASGVYDGHETFALHASGLASGAAFAGASVKRKM